MNNDWRADLHTHTSCSDGSDTPLELLSKAKDAGLSGLSITDHDTIQAYTPEVLQKAKELGLELLIGVEVSSEMEGLTVHILAYGFDRRFEEFLKEVVLRRQERNRKFLQYLKKKGMDLSEADIGSGVPEQIIGRPHIADALVQKGFVASRQEAFERYLKDGACIAAIGNKFHPREVIDAIHQVGGKAVLAHPHFLKRGRFVRELLAHSFDGIECYYGRLFKEQERPWLEVASKRNWIATGGSDYHGSMKSYISLGCSWTPLASYQKLHAPH